MPCGERVRSGLTGWGSATTLTPNPPPIIYLDAMRTPVLALAALLTVGLLAGCDSAVEEGPEGPTPEELFPLEVGNRWHYQTEYVGILDSVTVEITGALDVEHGGKHYRAYVEQFYYDYEEAARPPYAQLLAAGPGGLYVMGGMAPTDTLIGRYLNRKHPAEVGETWPMVRLSYRWGGERPHFAISDTLEATFVTADEELETPAGRFRCYVYKYTYLPADDVASYWDVFDYYAPGVGLVAQIQRASDSGELKQQMLLYAYELY